MNQTEKLKSMYEAQSKHSNYQILASSLSSVLEEDKLSIVSRHEAERLNYILDNISFADKKVIDVGGNTGYFTFEAITNRAKKVVYYEGNPNHAEFVSLATSILNLESQIEIHNEYFNFNSTELYDIGIVLNVLHHIGDDFGKNQLSIQKALEYMSDSLREMSKYINVLIFQLGFNWKGDRHLPLFANGTKNELINFVKTSIDGFYEIEKIGIAVKVDDKIVYQDLNQLNLLRRDELGEFLNRPLFILKKH